MKKLITSLLLIPTFLVGMPTTRLMSEKWESELKKSGTADRFKMEDSLLCTELEKPDSVDSFKLEDSLLCSESEKTDTADCFNFEDSELCSEKEIDESVIDFYFNLEDSLLCSERENYESVIDFIKAHEGYAGGKEYRCVSGRRTIGYGHVIKKGESFAPQISKEFADSLLRKDFSAAYNLTCKYTPQLKGSRKLAVAHFIFSKGITAFLKSGLRKAIESDMPVDEEFSKWCYYTDYKTGRKVYSKVGAGIQRWEHDMWHKDDALYAKSSK
jgi:lysozyme